MLASCKKNADTVAAPAGNDIQAAAGILNGETLSGNIVTGQGGDNNLVIVFNRGHKYVLIQKIPGIPCETEGEIKSAEMVTSKYGVMIKDDMANKVWLFANNDKESQQKFESVKKQLSGSYVTATVFGTTIINQDL
jgi:hypothetical protein